MSVMNNCFGKAYQNSCWESVSKITPLIYVSINNIECYLAYIRAKRYESC